MRMSDLAVDVPLAAIEDDMDSNDYQGVADLVASLDSKNNNLEMKKGLKGNLSEMETFGEPFSGSLEDLVSNFDEKIAQCLKNLDETTEKIAPVQRRTQEEIMNESQIWWTLTGNFGNILPIDWSKTYARKLQLPALHLQPKKASEPDDNKNELDLSEDEELTQAFDLHSLIVTSETHHHEPPPQTADEVIDEIDEIMQQSMNSEMTESGDFNMETFDKLCSPLKSPSMFLSQYNHDFELESRVREATSYVSSGEKVNDMKNFSYKKLVVLHSELESLIQIYNDTLVQELANRDELEYEKELKNTFISLLLSVQNKRRQYHMEKKRKSSKSPNSSNSSPNGLLAPQYLTAVIPYQEGCGHLNSDTLQALVKILRAVNENNSNVPNMLTDYILNVLCPSTASTPTV